MRSRINMTSVWRSIITGFSSQNLEPIRLGDRPAISALGATNAHLCSKVPEWVSAPCPSAHEAALISEPNVYATSQVLGALRSRLGMPWFKRIQGYLLPVLSLLVRRSLSHPRCLYSESESNPGS